MFYKCVFWIPRVCLFLFHTFFSQKAMSFVVLTQVFRWFLIVLVHDMPQVSLLLPQEGAKMQLSYIASSAGLTNAVRES